MANEPLEAADNLQFTVYLGRSAVGVCKVPVQEVIDSKDGVHAADLPLQSPKKKEDDKERGTLRLLLAYSNAQLPPIPEAASPRKKSKKAK